MRVIEWALWGCVCVRRVSLLAVDDVGGLIPLAAWIPLVLVFLDVPVPMSGIPRGIHKTLEVASNMPTTILKTTEIEASTSLTSCGLKHTAHLWKCKSLLLATPTTVSFVNPASRGMPQEYAYPHQRIRKLANAQPYF